MSVKTQQLFQALIVQLVKDFFPNYEKNLSKDGEQLSVFVNNSSKEFNYRESDDVVTISIPASVLFETVTTCNMFSDSAVFEATVTKDGLFTAGLYLTEGADESLEIDKSSFEAGKLDIDNLLQTCSDVYHNRL